MPNAMPGAMSNPDLPIWEGMLAHLRREHPLICRRWFEQLEPAGLHEGVVGVRAHSPVHRDYLRHDCLEAFNDAAVAASGQLVAVRFLGPDEPFGQPATPESPSAPFTPSERSRPAGAGEDNQRGNQLPINPDYAFDSFVIGPNNRLAHAASVAVSEQPARAYNPLFIHGDVGLGKTHLLQAICLKLRQDNPGVVIHYVSCDSFLSRFMETVREGQLADFRHEFRDVDVLVIDDIHFLAKRDRTQEEFFHTFNSLYQASKQIVLSSDAPPEDIPDLEDRLVSRFKWGLVAEIQPPGYETRVEILKAKARLRGFELPDSVAQHIATRIDTNIRELEGAIVTLQVLSSVEHTPISLDLARKAFGSGPSESRQGPTIETIITTVGDFYQVKRTELLGKRRHKSISLPRQVCMFLARKHTRHSLEEIGAHFGGRDHTTVLHAVRSIDSKRTDDAAFAETVDGLASRIR
ncbi:MAG: chromosomal replication initiator protein DnaA [Planctomycetota bacterium]